MEQELQLEDAWRDRQLSMSTNGEIKIKLLQYIVQFVFLVRFSVGEDSKQEKCTLAENQKPKWSTITVTFQCMRAASDEFCQTAKLFGCFFQQTRVKMTHCSNETPAGLIIKIIFLSLATPSCFLFLCRSGSKVKDSEGVFSLSKSSSLA